MIKRIWNAPITPFLVAGFLIFSWPFLAFPLTDGDIVNWVKTSVEMLQTHNLWSANDQAHGPLLAWTGVAAILWAKGNFYMLNAFNLVLGLLGILGVYRLADYLWQTQGINKLAAFLMCTCIAPVYLSRTPMYDWPAAICYLGFCYGYTKYCHDNKLSNLIFALAAVGVGSMLRFSIVLGLAGFYVILANFILKRGWKSLIKDGVWVALSVGLFNLPWLLSQVNENGHNFIKAFIYDNTGRYIKSTRPNAHVRKDFYGFPMYVLVGCLPFTFAAVLSVFNRQTWIEVKQNKSLQLIVAMFVPCLVLFTFSGHTKLARYISYVFPFLFIFLGYMWHQFYLHSDVFRRRCITVQGIIFSILGLLLIYEAYLFQTQVQEGVLFVMAVIAMLLALLAVGYLLWVKSYKAFATDSQKYLWPFVLIYMLFFTVLAYEAKHAPFLQSVEQGIRETIDRYQG